MVLFKAGFASAGAQPAGRAWTARGLTPGVGIVDRRVPANPSQPPWRGLGRVQTELGGRCTGTLVGPDKVLTAAHCLHVSSTLRLVQPGSVHFLLGYDHGRFAAHARATAFQIGPGYDPAREADTAGADWAVLTLDRPIGSPDRILTTATAEPPPGTALVLGGYGKDRAEVIYADPNCIVLAWTHDGQGRPLLRHDCAATSGTSGAPLLIQGASGVWALVGVQIGANRGGTGGIATVATSGPTGVY